MRTDAQARLRWEREPPRYQLAARQLPQEWTVQDCAQGHRGLYAETRSGLQASWR